MFKTTVLGLVLVWLSTGVASGGELPWLRTRGTQIVDAVDRPVILRGTNLGGWFVEEMWMMPFQTKPPEGSAFKEIKDHVTLWGTIEKRLGTDSMRRVRTAFRSAWITPADFDRLNGYGFNCVRLPFLYELIDEPGGLDWIEKAVQWAKARNIYVILDLHGAPGRQNNDHHSGEAGVNRLFRDPEKVKQTVAVWKRLAAIYRDRPEVAGFDLMNEPMGAVNHSTLYLVQDQIYRAIREVDSRHLIFIEDGYHGLWGMPDAKVVGWQNVVYSIHRYEFKAPNGEEHVKSIERFCGEVEKFNKDRPVPFYIGEFGIEPHGSSEIMKAYLKAMEKSKISWANWTYKTAFTGGSGQRSTWGIVRNLTPVKALDPFRDSEKELIGKIEQLRSEKMSEYQGMIDAFKSVTGK